MWSWRHVDLQSQDQKKHLTVVTKRYTWLSQNFPKLNRQYDGPAPNRCMCHLSVMVRAVPSGKRKCKVIIIERDKILTGGSTHDMRQWDIRLDGNLHRCLLGVGVGLGSRRWGARALSSLLAALILLLSSSSFFLHLHHEKLIKYNNK